MEEQIHNIAIERIEADEIWGFIGKKEGHKTEGEKANFKRGGGGGGGGGG